jgi:hypothetical protein
MDNNVINQIRSISQYQSRSGAVAPTAATKAQAEFMTIFYKEILKQVFTTPKVGLEEEESGFNTTISAMNSDLMAEKLAEHMVQNALASNQWALPTAEGKAE